MKKTIKLFTFLLMLMITAISCEKISDEQITLKLSMNGEIDPSLLIGEWEFEKFAYTVDGKKISDVANISGSYGFKPTLTIPFAPTTATREMEDYRERLWMLVQQNTSWYSCSLSGNLIELKNEFGTLMYITPPSEYYDVLFSFSNAYSFVINGNELIIYFKQVKDKNALSYCTLTKDKNLLILKKKDNKHI